MICSNFQLILMLTLCCFVAVAENNDYPSMEFLEFLGEWENEQGEWVDPIALPDDGNPSPQLLGEEEEQDDES